MGSEWRNSPFDVDNAEWEGGLAWSSCHRERIDVFRWGPLGGRPPAVVAFYQLLQALLLRTCGIVSQVAGDNNNNRCNPRRRGPIRTCSITTAAKRPQLLRHKAWSEFAESSPPFSFGTRKAFSGAASVFNLGFGCLYLPSYPPSAPPARAAFSSHIWVKQHHQSPPHRELQPAGKNASFYPPNLSAHLLPPTRRKVCWDGRMWFKRPQDRHMCFLLAMQRSEGLKLYLKITCVLAQ